MNCKPGDLVVQVHAVVPENLGSIFTVIRLATKEDFFSYGFILPIAPIWLTDSVKRDASGHLTPFCYDDQLRPIRDNPGNETWFKAAPIKTTELV